MLKYYISAHFRTVINLFSGDEVSLKQITQIYNCPKSFK